MLRTILFIGLIVLIPRDSSAQQILSFEEIRIIEAHIPRMESGIIYDTVHSSHRIWYTSRAIGVAYQIGTGYLSSEVFPETGRLGVADAIQNDTANGMDFASFPYHHVAGGSARSPNASDVKCFKVPLQSDEDRIKYPQKGPYWPVVVFEDTFMGFESPEPTVMGFDWMWPDGGVLVEFIYVNDLIAKQHYCFMIPARIRHLDNISIEFMVPWRTADELKTDIQRLQPNWRSFPQTVAFISHLENGGTLSGRLRDNNPGNPKFSTQRGDILDLTTQIDIIPPLDRLLVSKLLDKAILKDGAGYEWKPGCVSPTTDEDFHIIPRNWDGAFRGNDSISCINCHKGARSSAWRYGISSKRGYVRGSSEGDLSWNPFENLTKEPNPNPRLRQSWVDAGIVAWYDPELHPLHIYQRLKLKELKQ